MAKNGSSKDNDKQSSSKSQMIAVVIIVVILITVPLAYFLMTGDTDEDDNGDEKRDDVILRLTGISGTENLTMDDLTGMTGRSGISSFENSYGNIRSRRNTSGFRLRKNSKPNSPRLAPITR